MKVLSYDHLVCKPYSFWWMNKYGIWQKSKLSDILKVLQDSLGIDDDNKHR